MYAVTSNPFVSRTLAILRKAELGFFGVIVLTCTHTPLLCGAPSLQVTLFLRELWIQCIAGDLDFLIVFRRPFRTSWLIVGTNIPHLVRGREDSLLVSSHSVNDKLVLISTFVKSLPARVPPVR